jgi:hypothetical protein
MRARIAVLVGVGAITLSLNASAQPSTPGGGATDAPLLPPPPSASATVTPDPTPAAAPPPAALSAPPGSGVGVPPMAAMGSLTGTPNPNAINSGPGDEASFSTHGFIRAPMRMGMSSRPACPTGVAPGTLVAPNGKALTGVQAMGEPQGENAGATMSGSVLQTQPGKPFSEVQCGGPGQSNTDLHSPRLADDQYLDPRFTRQWEKDWTEVFFNYGNSRMVGTVAFQAFGLTDAEHTSVDNLSSQLGIAQAWVTLMPSVGKLRLNWKVGAFWDKFGMSGKYDAGKYDMYLFGRLHVMGQTLRAEYPVGGFTFKAIEGFGVKNEELEFTPITYGFPGYTLVGHVHGGVSYKKAIDVNAHYITAWAQDARITGPAGAQGEPNAGVLSTNPGSGGLPNGHIDVAGAEARITPGGAFGELYVGYSYLTAVQAEQVGPALEPIASLGGYSGGTQIAAAPTTYPGPVPGSNYYGPNGIMDNYLGSCFKCMPNQIGTGSVNSFLVQYDFSFGTLVRKIQNPNSSFWGDGPEVTLNLFGLYQTVSSTDTSHWFPLVGDGVKKLKYGADLIVTPLPWFAFGARADYVQPTSLDPSESFGVISPKVMFRSKYLSHEEITMQYSHYFYGVDVLPQPPNGPAASFANGTKEWPVYAPDPNVFGIKATMWW